MKGNLDLYFCKYKNKISYICYFANFIKLSKYKNFSIQFLNISSQKDNHRLMEEIQGHESKTHINVEKLLRNYDRYQVTDLQI